MTKIGYDVTEVTQEEDQPSGYDMIVRALLARDGRHAGQDYVCPTHDDRRPSLGVTVDRSNGKALVHCSAGCRTKDVLHALGLTEDVLFITGGSRNGHNGKKGGGHIERPMEPLPSEGSIWKWADALEKDRYWTRKRNIPREVLRTYQVGWNPAVAAVDGSGRVGAYTFPYRDASGALMNVKRRWQATGAFSKTFLLNRGYPTDFLWPEDQLTREWVVLVEGEPDALRLIGLGLPAVTGITGVGGATRSARTYALTLKGMHVVVAFDSSVAGRRAAAEVAHIVAGYAASVRVFDPFPNRNDDSDMSDWFTFYGDDVDRFRNAIKGLPVLETSGLEMPTRDWLFPDGKFSPPRLGMSAEEAARLRVGPDGKLWRYAGGVYHHDGEAWLGSYVKEVLGIEFREARLREVRSWCKASQVTIPTEAETDYINCVNGLLYWKNDPPLLTAHTPEVPSVAQIGARWNPKADCDDIMTFLGQVLPEDCIDFMFEWIGYLLIPTSKYQRALMLEGPGDTGKSTLLIMLETFLGKTSISHHTLQSICDDRFTRADLYGRLANIYADLDARTIQSASAFKTITAGDPISAEHKFGHPFSFRPWVRQMYSANELPGTSDQSDAYYKRWMVLPMHNKLDIKQQDPAKRDALTSPTELSGLLNRSIAGLRRLEKRRRFQVPETMKAALVEYRGHTDTVFAWGNERLTHEVRSKVRVGDAFRSYAIWCEDNNRHAIGQQRFKQHLVSLFPWADVGQVHGYAVFRGVKLS